MKLRRRQVDPVAEYAFCERATASPRSPHHIRQLTSRGMLTGGGADTAALCGAEVAWDTSAVGQIADWDLLTRPRESPRDASWRACLTCVVTYRQTACKSGAGRAAAVPQTRSFGIIR